MGYNNDTGSNVRQNVLVTEVNELYRNDSLDILLYMNNFSLIEKGEISVKAGMHSKDALPHFTLVNT